MFNFIVFMLPLFAFSALGGWKGIRPVKTERLGAGMVIS